MVRVYGYCGAEASQISKGKFEATTSIFAGDAFCVGRRYANLSCSEKGGLSKGITSFYFLSGPGRVHLNGRGYSQGSIVVNSNSFIQVMPDDYCNYFIAVNEVKASRIFTSRDMNNYFDIKNRLGKYNIVSTDLVDTTILIINSILSIVKKENNSQISPLIIKDINYKLFRAILKISESDVASPVRVNARDKIVGRALEYMVSSDLSKIGLIDVARSAHVSQRALELAFKSCLGISPKEKLVGMRLNSIRRDILMTGKTVSIRSIARRYGVVHMGHFGRSYKALFGEMPCETKGMPL